LFFAGCEGNSERAYVALMNRLAESVGLAVSIHGEPLNPGAGDPIALIARAIERIRHKRQHGAYYRRCVVFLDSDTTDREPERATRARLLASEADIRLVWQRPNHEAVLLRHLPGCRDLRPDASRSLADLRKHWANYDKGTVTALEMSRYIARPQVEQAATVEPELREFLEIVGLLD
jgi:hypothetical protein